MKKILFCISMVLPILLFGCFADKGIIMKPLETVNFVDLNRYVGKWYEIARYPNSFQKSCVGSMATYSLRDDGKKPYIIPGGGSNEIGALGSKILQ